VRNSSTTNDEIAEKQATQGKQEDIFKQKEARLAKEGNQKRTLECEAWPAKQKRGTACRTASCNPMIVAFGSSTQQPV